MKWKERAIAPTFEGTPRAGNCVHWTKRQCQRRSGQIKYDTLMEGVMTKRSSEKRKGKGKVTGKGMITLEELVVIGGNTRPQVRPTPRVSRTNCRTLQVARDRSPPRVPFVLLCALVRSFARSPVRSFARTFHR